MTPVMRQIGANYVQYSAGRVVFYLRIQLLPSLDGLQALVRELIEPAISSSALDRLLRADAG